VSRQISSIVMLPRFLVIAVRQQSRRRAPTPDGFALSPPRRFLGRQRWAVEQPVKPSSPFSHSSRDDPVRPRKNNPRASPLKLKSGDNPFDPLPRLFDPTSCDADHQPERGGSWLNVRRHQKYKSERNCEGETQPNAVRREGLPRLRRQRPSPNARQ